MVFQTIGLMKEEVLAAVPLFIFMGYLMEQGGLMDRLFRGFQLLMGPVPGSLYVGVLITATIFGIAAGTVGATVVLMGIMAVPIMTKAGYDIRMSAGAITAGGTLGILVPPSVMLVVMGPVMGVSVAELYASCFGPGFLLAGIFIAYTLIRSLINPRLGPPLPPEERMGSLKDIVVELTMGMCRTPCSSLPPSAPLSGAGRRPLRRLPWALSAPHSWPLCTASSPGSVSRTPSTTPCSSPARSCSSLSRPTSSAPCSRG